MIFYGEPNLATAKLSHRFDAAIFACGFESRARFFVERGGVRAERCCAIEFTSRRDLAFDVNRSFFEAAGVDVVTLSDAEVRDWASSYLANASIDHDSPLRVFIDVSSQSRSRMAALLEAVEVASQERDIDVVFGYALAKYVAPTTVPAPILSIGPVSPRFAGWSVEPELHTTLVVGLGYEQNRAMGAVEYLEPGDVWALFPRSRIPEYTTALRRANRDLLSDIAQRQQLSYQVEDPNGTFALLNSLMLHFAGKANTTLLPSGPKILALLSLLTSMSHPGVAVWRVTAGDIEIPVDRVASGARILTRALFRAPRSAPAHPVGEEG